MQFYQMNITELEAFLKNASTVSQNFENVEENKSTKILGYLKDIFEECKSKITYISVLLLAGYLISSIFSLLNHEWILFWTIFCLAVLSVLFFVFECSLLYFLKKRYKERIKKEENIVRVFRDNALLEISTADLKQGDRIALEKGTVLPGDARIVLSNQLYSNESMVFGKTIPTKKTHSTIEENNLYPEDQSNMLWKGSFISEGSGEAIIVSLGEDCYIHKTGGRRKKAQRSAIFNQKSNIGKIAALVYILVSTLLMLIAGFATGEWLNSIAVYCAFLSLFIIEPVSFLTAWTYYNTAERFYKMGVLVRDIRAFDGMNDESVLYLKSTDVIKRNCSFNQFLNVVGSEEQNRLCFAKMLPENSVCSFDVKSSVGFKQTKCKNADGNFEFSVFSEEDNGFAAICGYWKELLPYVADLSDDFIQHIHELELHGKAVWLYAVNKVSFVPAKLNVNEFLGKMNVYGFALLTPAFDADLSDKIHRLQKSGVSLKLINQHSKEFGVFLRKSYDLENSSDEPINDASYSVVEGGGVVANHAMSQIQKQNAKIIYKNEALPLNVIYETKCMVCGIERSLNFLSIIGFFLMISAFVAFLFVNSAPLIVFPIIILQPLFLNVCHHITSSVRNCQQNKMSFIFGGLFSITLFISAFVIGVGALPAFALCISLYSISLLLQRMKHHSLSRKELLFIIMALLLAIFIWFFLDFNYIAAILFAIFPVVSARIIDLLY